MAQMRRIEPFFPRSRGLTRADDRRVVSGIVTVMACSGKTRRAAYGPPKTLYNRFVRRSRPSVFASIFAALAAERAAEGGPSGRLMIDATHLKAHRTAASLLRRGGSPRRPHQGRAELENARRLRRAGNASGRLKDWRRVATRSDRCAHCSASICIAATLSLLAMKRSPEPSG